MFSHKRSIEFSKYKLKHKHQYIKKNINNSGKVRKVKHAWGPENTY